MKVTLHNFCCHSDNSFTFPDAGLVLLTGVSGKGKSSILRAIRFAFFGTGRKLEKYNTKHCWVKVEYKNLNIYRSKGPCRLVVNELEDDEAQGLIDKNINSFFLDQFQEDSLLKKSPLQRLEYIEKLAFSNCKIDEIKVNLKNKIKEAEREEIKLQTECNMLENNLKNVIEKPSIVVDDVEQEKVKTIQNIEQHKILISNIQSDLGLFIKYNERLKSRNEELSDLNDELIYFETTKMNFDNEKYIACKNELDNFKNIQNYKSQRQEIRQLEELINNLEIDDFYDKLYKIQEQQSQLPSFSDCCEMNQLLTKKITNLENYKFLLKQLDSLPVVELLQLNLLNEQKIDLETKLRYITTYNCPECDSLLFFSDNNLKKAEKECHEDPEILQNNLKKIIREIDIVTKNLEKRKYIETQMKSNDVDYLSEEENLKSEKDKYNDYISSHKSFKQLEKDIEQSIQKVEMKERNYEKQLENKKIEAKNLKTKCVNPTRSLEECEKEYRQLENQKNSKEIYDKQFEQLKFKIKICENEITKCNDNISSLKYKNQNDLDTVQKKYTKLFEHLKKIDDYVLWLEFDSKQKSLNKFTLNLNNIRKKLANLTKFKELIQQAEALSVLNVLDQLNNFANYYLQMFFKDEPLTSQLMPYKETLKKQKKPSIELLIEYKGYSIKEYENLSGGESERLMLAYTLACADFLHSGLVFLDECTASLDINNANDVYDCLKNCEQDRMYLIIAHQTIIGNFDSVIQL
jgi:exonuclease SbcC